MQDPNSLEQGLGIYYRRKDLKAPPGHLTLNPEPYQASMVADCG